MRNYLRKTALLILAIIVFIGFSGCDNAEKGIDDKVVQVDNFVEFLEKNAEKINIELVDSSNWNTYVDERYGLSFKYPESWTVQKVDVKERPIIKDCYEYNGRNGCSDKYGGYDMKFTMRRDRILCINPNIENLKRECYIEINHRTPTFESIKSVWDMLGANYKSSEDAEYLKYFKMNDKIFFSTGTKNSFNFWSINADLFEAWYYDKDVDSKDVYDGILHTLEF